MDSQLDVRDAASGRNGGRVISKGYYSSLCNQKMSLGSHLHRF